MIFIYKYVLQKLSKTDFTEVIPIKDEPMHENFLTKELTKRAKFYAIIMSDTTIMIALQFNHENDKIYYGGLYAENFMEHFKIID